jgi:hypothetical protein
MARLAPVEALFILDRDRLVPTELVRGPWRPDAQHGGPPAAVDRVRLKVPLVAGEETSGLCRLLAAADVGSGISAV